MRAKSERGTCFHVGAVLGAGADDTLKIVALEERLERQITKRRVPVGMDVDARPRPVRTAPFRPLRSAESSRPEFRIQAWRSTCTRARAREPALRSRSAAEAERFQASLRANGTRSEPPPADVQSAAAEREAAVAGLAETIQHREKLLFWWRRERAELEGRIEVQARAAAHWGRSSGRYRGQRLANGHTCRMRPGRTSTAPGPGAGRVGPAHGGARRPHTPGRGSRARRRAGDVERVQALPRRWRRTRSPGRRTSRSGSSPARSWPAITTRCGALVTS